MLNLKHSHPTGLWVLSFSALICCFSFACINSILIIYATRDLHFSLTSAYLLSATYNSLLFTLPLAGGYLAERLGYQRALYLGAMLQAIALHFISIPTPPTLLLGLSTYASGVAFFIPTYLVLIDKLYHKEDARRESGFTLSYIIINIGFLLGNLYSGFMTNAFGYTTSFHLVLLINLLIFVIYYSGRKHIKAYSGRSIKAQANISATKAWLYLALSAAVLVFSSFFLLHHNLGHDLFLTALIVVVTLSIIYMSYKQKRLIARKKVFAFLILCYFSVAFWALYALEPSLLTIFIRDHVNRHLFGVLVPSATFYGLDPFFIIVLGISLSFLWHYLIRINKNPSLPTKFSLSLFTMAIGFFVLVAALWFSPEKPISVIWIVACYFFLALAELFISPIGNSMVGRLAPEGMEGRFMGVWQLFTGFSGAVSGLLARLTVVPDQALFADTSKMYLHAFINISLATLLVALLSLLILPTIQRLIMLSRMTRRRSVN